MFFFEPSIQTLLCIDPNSSQVAPVIIEILMKNGWRLNGITLLPRAHPKMIEQVKPVANALRLAFRELEKQEQLAEKEKVVTLVPPTPEPNVH